MARTLWLVAFALVASHYMFYVDAVGCGIYIPPGGSCSDWQCSRNASNYCVKGVGKGKNCTTDGDCYVKLMCSLTEHVCVKEEAASKNAALGLVGAFLGVLCFGSSFVPMKRYKKFAGDGVFAQFCMNFGRFMVGFVILLTRTNRWFYWDAALGGSLWCIGNAMGVPIIQCIGIGLGVSLWGSTNMLLGWASGHFGLWGIKQEVAEYPALEYVSVLSSLGGILLFLWVKPQAPQLKTEAKQPAPCCRRDNPTHRGQQRQHQRQGTRSRKRQEGSGAVKKTDAGRHH